jgi:hypothetical protein
LFKKRDVEPLLREGVKTVKVVEDAGEGAAGRYNSQSKQIIVVAGVTTAKLKMLDNFMHEVFVHEFGHHVHMTHMDASGRESWDAGWEFVDKAQADLNSKISVTPADRQRFFDLIERSGWSPQKAGRKVRGLDRLKYLMWLYKPMTNRIISTPNQVRLTDYGKAIFDFFRDPEASVAEFLEAGNSPDRVGRMLDRKTRMYKGALGLTSDYAGVNHPMLDEASVEKVRAEDRSVDEALDALGIPTAYGRTNVKEDFAETFVLWMVHPERLSEQARNRMGRALWLSGFYGKPVMRVARRGDREMASSVKVAARWLKQSKNLPKHVERYVQEGKDQGLDEGEAWAVAWSRYCKFRNPDSPHCKKDSPEDYLPNQGKKQAGGRPNADFEAEVGDIYPIGMDGSFSIPTTAFVSDLRGNEKKVRGVLEGHLKQTEQRDFRTMLQETGAKRLRFNFADSLIIGSGAEGMFGIMQWDDGIEVYFDGAASNEFMGAPPVFMVEGTFQPQ